MRDQVRPALPEAADLPDCRVTSNVLIAADRTRDRLSSSEAHLIEGLGRTPFSHRPGRPLDHLAGRPPPEPAIAAAAFRLEIEGFTQAGITRLASDLLGRPARWRTGEAVSGTRATPSQVRYPIPGPADDLISLLSTVQSDRRFTDVQAAAVLMGLFMTEHALEDGNGRTARALFQLSLLDRRLISQPIAPLGPLACVLMDQHVAAIQRLSWFGAWAGFIEHVESLVQMTLEISRVEYSVKTSALGSGKQ